MSFVEKHGNHGKKIKAIVYADFSNNFKNTEMSGILFFKSNLETLPHWYLVMTYMELFSAFCEEQNS